MENNKKEAFNPSKSQQFLKDLTEKFLRDEKALNLQSKEDLSSSTNKRRKTEKTFSEDFNLSLNFGKDAVTLSKQLKVQGHKFNEDYINDCEEIRVSVLALNEVKIISKKELIKSLKRLHNQIAYHIVYETYGDNIKSIKSVK